jgi:hypothetical protein
MFPEWYYMFPEMSPECFSAELHADRDTERRGGGGAAGGQFGFRRNRLGSLQQRREDTEAIPAVQETDERRRQRLCLGVQGDREMMIITMIIIIIIIIIIRIRISQGRLLIRKRKHIISERRNQKTLMMIKIKRS